MKKALSLILALAMVFCVCSVASASDDGEIFVFLDGKEIVFPDQKPVIINDRTLVPLRGILEAMGATVGWDEATSTVTSEKDGIVIKLTINDPVIYRNGEAIALDVPAQLINQRTMVPARAVSESFGARVEWNEGLSCVTISTDELLNSALDTCNSADEFYWSGSVNTTYQELNIAMGMDMGFDYKNNMMLLGLNIDMGIFGQFENNTLTSDTKTYIEQSGEITVQDTTELLEMESPFAPGTPFARIGETETEVTYEAFEGFGMRLIVDKATAMPVKLSLSKELLDVLASMAEGFVFEGDMTGDIVLNGGKLIELMNNYEAALAQ